MSTPVRVRPANSQLLRMAEVIIDLFATRGFAGVTVEEAARAAGISRASFFRYFGSKEDVVITYFESTGVDHASAVKMLPETAVSALQLVRAALEPAVREIEATPERYRERLAMIATEPALRTRLTAHRMNRRDVVAAAIAARVDDPSMARIAAASGLAAYDVAWDEWRPGGPTTFRIVVDAVFRRVEKLGERLPGTPSVS